MADQGIPSSILIVGSGVFGMGTAYALSQRPEYKNTKITLLDRLDFPAEDASSIDSSRIIRADYDTYHYSALCMEALELWRGDWGAEGRYHQPGLAILIDENSVGSDKKAQMQKDMQANLQKLGLKIGPKEDGGQVTVLADEKSARAVAPTLPGAAGQSGYVNWTSGWANAEEGMRYLYQKVVATGRVEIRRAEIEGLIFSEHGSSVRGAKLKSGEEVKADLTMLATGAWTPKFIDLRGVASASGQVLAYTHITDEEQEALAHNPTVLNASTGMFLIPPRNNVLKVARHGYGYANFKTIPHPEPSGSGQSIEVSLPRTKQDDPNMQIPQEAQKACRDFLGQVLPQMKDRPWTHTRVCWYTDTPRGEWLIDYHPKYKGLFVATGGSGHAYKFVPIVGERIVDVMLDQHRDDLGKTLKEKWSWPKTKYHSDHIWTDDWRGGKKGMILDDELRMGQADPDPPQPGM